MRRHTKRLRFSVRIVLALTTGVALYLASYRYLLNPIVVVEVGHMGMVIKGSREPHYKLANPVCRILFAPIEKIDYKMRPAFWDHYSDEWPAEPTLR